MLHVPATIFGDTREYLVYEGVVQRVRRKNQHDGGEVEVYFKIDGQTFWFATALAESWLPDAAPARQRPRKRGGGERRRKGAATTADEEAAIADAFANACGDGSGAAAASSQVVTEAEGVKLILSDRNSTGYHNVRPERSRYRTYNYEDGKQKHIGTPPSRRRSRTRATSDAARAAAAAAAGGGGGAAAARSAHLLPAAAGGGGGHRCAGAVLRLRRAAPRPHVRAAARSCCQLEPTAASAGPRTAGDRRGGARGAGGAGGLGCVGQGGGGGGRLRQVPQRLDKPRFGGPGLKRKRCSAPTEGEEAGDEAAEVVRLHLEGQPTLCVGW